MNKEGKGKKPEKGNNTWVFFSIFDMPPSISLFFLNIRVEFLKIKTLLAQV